MMSMMNERIEQMVLNTSPAVIFKGDAHVGDQSVKCILITFLALMHIIAYKCYVI